jgi:cell division protein FtsA
MGMLPMGIAITGGCALLPGMVQMAMQFLDTPSRLEVPRGVGGMVDTVSSPVYSTSVGLVMYAAAQRMSVRDDGSGPSLMSNMVTGLKKLFKS